MISAESGPMSNPHLPHHTSWQHRKSDKRSRSILTTPNALLPAASAHSPFSAFSSFEQDRRRRNSETLQNTLLTTQRMNTKLTRRHAAKNGHFPSSDKDWSELGVAVYRVGVGMYHSSVVVDDVEWHFWEGLGVEPLFRYFDQQQQEYVSIEHIPIVMYLPIDTLMVSPRSIANLCHILGDGEFTKYTGEDIKQCIKLLRLGVESKMPTWINRLASTADTVCSRLPFIRTWIDSLLSRKEVISRNHWPNDTSTSCCTSSSMEGVRQTESLANTSSSTSTGPTDNYFQNKRALQPEALTQSIFNRSSMPVNFPTNLLLMQQQQQLSPPCVHMAAPLVYTTFENRLTAAIRAQNQTCSVAQPRKRCIQGIKKMEFSQIANN